MSNISSNIGVGSGIPEVAEIPATGSDGDLIRFRGILFRWDKDAGAWRPLPTREWQELEGWSTGDLTHWKILTQDPEVSYTVSNGYLEVTIDDTGGNYTAAAIRFAGGDVRLPPRAELRTKVSVHTPNPSTGGAGVRWLLRSKDGSSESASRVVLGKESSGDRHKLKGYDSTASRVLSDNVSTTWSQDNKHDLIWGGGYKGDVANKVHFYSEQYDEGGSLQSDERGDVSPFPRAAGFLMNLNPNSTAKSVQTFRVHSISLRSLT